MPLHAVLCDLIPGGVSKQIRAAAAARVLEQARPSGAVQQARHELAAEFLADLCHIDAQLRQTRKKLAAAVRASGTTVTEVFGVGPAIAATVIGDVRDISRFPSRDRFAAYNGTAPVEVSSGNRVIYRLSLRGNRRLNHAIHMAAVTQIRYQHSPGRAYYDKKIAEGKTPKEALRALKRQISDALYKRPEGRRGPRPPPGPGGQPGNGSSASVAGSHPERRLFGQATPGPAPTLRSRPATSKAGRHAQRRAGSWPARSSCPQAPNPARRPRNHSSGEPALNLLTPRTKRIRSVCKYWLACLLLWPRRTECSVRLGSRALNPSSNKDKQNIAIPHSNASSADVTRIDRCLLLDAVLTETATVSISP